MLFRGSLCRCTAQFIDALLPVCCIVCHHPLPLVILMPCICISQHICKQRLRPAQNFKGEIVWISRLSPLIKAPILPKGCRQDSLSFSSRKVGKRFRRLQLMLKNNCRGDYRQRPFITAGHKSFGATVKQDLPSTSASWIAIEDGQKRETYLNRHHGLGIDKFPLNF